MFIIYRRCTCTFEEFTGYCDRQSNTFLNPKLLKRLIWVSLREKIVFSSVFLVFFGVFCVLLFFFCKWCMSVPIGFYSEKSSVQCGSDIWCENKQSQ